MSKTSGELWPDCLELGDIIELAGREFEVVGTGPAEATLECVEDESYTAEVFRWAFSNAVGVETEVAFEQDEFGRLVTKSGKEGADE